VQTGKAFVVGQPVMIASTASPSTNWMAGNITAYTSGTGALVVDVVWTRGSATLAAWTVSLSAPANPAAVSKAGDAMTGALEWAPIVTLASAATTNIGTAASNVVQITGTTTITALGTAASGAERTVIFAGALTLTHNATSLILPSATNITTVAGDTAKFVSLGSGNWKCIAFSRQGSILYSPTNNVLGDKNASYSIVSSNNLTLPDLTGAQSFNLIFPSNSTTVPSAATTSNGWNIVTGASAGVFSMIRPFGTVTAHGTWGSTLMRPPALSTATVAGGALSMLGTAQIDTNLVVAIYRTSTTVYAVAINTSTNTIGAPVTMMAYNTSSGVGVWANSTTSFVVVCNDTASTSKVQAGSISGTTITLGTAVSLVSEVTQTIKLADGLYTALCLSSTDLQAFSVSGTAVTTGTAIASGSYSGATPNTAKIRRLSNTAVLVAVLATGGGTSTTRALSVVVGSISGTTITLNTPATGTNIEANAGFRLFESFTDGSSYFAVVQNGATATSGDWYGITVSGTTVTLGTVSTRTNDLPTASTGESATIFKVARAFIKYDASTYLFGHLAAGPYAMTISGTTLTFGSSGGPTEEVSFLKDANTLSIFYAKGSSAFYKLNVSGTTITSVWSVAAAPNFIISDTLTDKAVNYSGTWYAWAIDSISQGSSSAVTPTKILYSSGNANLTLGGPIA
jgi:hypothetical protein